ncbi:nitrate- and nitrite sensing domain-containing protein [Streptomyces sp. TLI_146]|uniref:nitrate- and nitrite sensing domain-containing protein n=1 Tax=Streptomyces sp. TLI_146 TaxID=1938858 RepID=UPI000C711AF7|nr:nitrate- and nitrite sensing domain-containing protein [Streptomyces sp. TLI_146]PKV84540.1 signal transduction histidine kinase [Streptomyces sp. TLI_146]
MRFRGKSIRRKIVALLLVPLVSLTALWGFTTYITGREANELLNVTYIVDKVGSPMEDTVQVIQEERRQTLVYLADQRAADALAALQNRRRDTDRAVAKIRSAANDSQVRDDLRPAARARLKTVLEEFDGIGDLRRQVDRRSLNRTRALEAYSDVIEPCYTFLTNLHALENVDMDKQGRAVVGLARAREMLAREDALVASSLVAPPQFTWNELREVVNLVANRTLLYEISLENLPAGEREIFERFWAASGSESLRAAEQNIITAGPTKNPKVDLARWQQTATPLLARLSESVSDADDRYRDRVHPVAFNVLIKAGVAGVLGFLALVFSLFLSVRIGRELIRDLTRLRKEAHEVSGVRLPSVMRRLAAGEQVDVETEAPRLDYEKDEVGQVGQALNTLQRAAVEAAVKQADMRRGVAEVFVNLARRNQVLLHRQLTLLDTMERRTEDTDELADLFRLDHLTTRMRRHAEGLVILSGAAPSRQWRKPVQLMDVVRAAVAEVEDYERIEVRRLPRLGVGGPAVADLTHLVAELLENATVFSPPHTAVQVHGERVANGFTLEIHDRGLGMTPEALLDANLRLAETPEFELSDTDRLGLFVVSRLAQRQNVRVSLQPSPYGGTTAIVFIPAALLTDAPDTNGTGFRLDRKAAHGDAAGRRERDAGPRALNPLPVGIPDRALLDGPVELEAPVDPLELDAPHALGADERDDDRTGFLGAPRGVPAERRQHPQSADEGAGAPARPSGPVPLPRRRPPAPTLVSDHGRRVDDQPGRDHPPYGAEPVRPAGPTPELRRADALRASGLVPAPAPEPLRRPAHARESADGTGPQGALPRRVRQASLAPQLKETSAEPADRTGPGGPGAQPQPERDAEEVRNRMASMQRGWQRGRRHNAMTSAETTADGPDQALGGVRRNTSEGDGR